MVIDFCDWWRGVNDQSWAVFLVPAFLDFLLISSCLQITVIDPIPWLSSLSYIQAGVWKILYKDIFLAKYFLDWKCHQISKHSSNLVRRNVCKGSYKRNFAVSFCHIVLSKLINNYISNRDFVKSISKALFTYTYAIVKEGISTDHWPILTGQMISFCKQSNIDLVWIPNTYNIIT